MHVQRRDDAPRNERGGQVSHLLFTSELGSPNLAVTWVQGEPGGQQGIHAHEDSDQVYVIIRGRGVTIADSEEREVEAAGAGPQSLLKTSVYVAGDARADLVR